MSDERPFHETLQAFMAEREMTPEGFSAELQKASLGFIRVSSVTVRNWMAGTNTPKGGTQRAIADVMNAPMASLFPETAKAV